MENQKDEYVLSMFEVCELLNKSKRSISRYIRRGLLHPIQVKSRQGTLEYRFSEIDVKDFKEGQPRQDYTEGTRQAGQVRQEHGNYEEPDLKEHSPQTRQDRPDTKDRPGVTARNESPEESEFNRETRRDTQEKTGQKGQGSQDGFAALQTQATTTRYDVEFNGGRFPSGKRQWATPPSGMKRLIRASRVAHVGGSLVYLRYMEDFPVSPLRNVWTDTSTGGFGDEKVYVVQTTSKIVERCLLMTTDPGDLVLDPTCGSGTTAYVAEKWGRRWITLDTSRVAMALTRTRLMAAKYPYYLLADSPEGVKKEAELTGKVPPDYRTEGDLKKGFVYKRVPHITLKAIAHNEEIDAIHAKCQEKLDPLRQELNQTLNQTWEEWQIPREPEDAWPQPSKDLLTQWWSLRRERQQEVDASIARRADTELLYDQPYEDPKRLRVTGPFTVESLSPHRVLAPEVELPESEAQAQREADLGQFETMILDNLKKAGVQNTIKNERLKFDRLEPYAGEWLHASGEYTEADGTVRRAAVCLGPEHGTVGPELVKEAAKEAVKGMGFDLLIVCGFAFDPHVSEEAKRFGKLTVLPCRMNPDLAMGDELLKKTGAGNLFMVFGEPDVELRQQKDGTLVVEIKGLDIYDPTTGQIRSSSTDDIACWFIDTNYNGESFFVRHAYFTGADQPYDKLKRALRADIDEAAWSALYSTTSRPFPKPTTGKIAIKVINHYGDEVLKIYEV